MKKMSNKLNEVEIKLIKKIIENGGNVKTVSPGMVIFLKHLI